MDNHRSKGRSPAPQPGGTLTSAEARWLSPYGEVKSAWEKTEKGIKYRITIPPNCTAEVMIGGKTELLTTGGYKYEL